MANYRNYKELEGKTLELKDQLFLLGEIYRVSENSNHNLFLENLDSCYEDDRVFDKLFIFFPREFCRKSYGYSPVKTKSGLFPMTKPDDFQALTNLVLRLFEKIDKRR